MVVEREELHNISCTWVGGDRRETSVSHGQATTQHSNISSHTGGERGAK